MITLTKNKPKAYLFLIPTRNKTKIKTKVKHVFLIFTPTFINKNMIHTKVKFHYCNYFHQQSFHNISYILLNIYNNFCSSIPKVSYCNYFHQHSLHNISYILPNINNSFYNILQPYVISISQILL